MFKKLLLILLFVAAGISVANKLNQRAVKKLPLEGKMKKAEEYLSTFQKDAEAALTRLEAAGTSAPRVIKEMKSYNRVMKAHSKKINNLNLPCPSTARGRPDMQSYVQWTRTFQTRERSIMNGFSKRLEKALAKAGFTKH